MENYKAMDASILQAESIVRGLEQPSGSQEELLRSSSPERGGMCSSSGSSGSAAFMSNGMQQGFTPVKKPTRSQQSMYQKDKDQGKFDGTVEKWVKIYSDRISQRQLNALKPKMSKTEAGKKGYASGLANFINQKSVYSTPNEGVQIDRVKSNGKTKSSEGLYDDRTKILKEL